MRRISSLPEEIIEENILTRLPVKSISRFRCVSKSWRLLFRNPNFIKKNLNQAILMNKFNILIKNYGNKDSTPNPYLSCIDNNVLSSTSSGVLGHAVKIDYPFMSPGCLPDIVGSCNGLICIKPFYGGLCIWNPATREYKGLPKPWTYSKNRLITHGFGFDCKNNDYKVLKIVLDRGDRGESEVFEARLYSLASNSWKYLGVSPYEWRQIKGVLHKGVLHWVGLKSKVIVCFDFSDETFHEVPLPYTNNSNEVQDYRFMGIWKGKLCILQRSHIEDFDICTHQYDHIDVWTMMDNKWSRHLKINTHIIDMSYPRPIQTLQNGEILLEGGPRRNIDNIGLVSYDPNLERARALKIHGLPDSFRVETYIETLVTVGTGTYVGK